MRLMNHMRAAVCQARENTPRFLYHSVPRKIMTMRTTRTTLQVDTRRLVGSPVSDTYLTGLSFLQSALTLRACVITKVQNAHYTSHDPDSGRLATNLHPSVSPPYPSPTHHPPSGLSTDHDTSPNAAYLVPSPPQSRTPRVYGRYFSTTTRGVLG